MDEVALRGDQVIPFFYIKAVKNNFRSKQEGRPVYEDKEYVQKLMPGNKTEIPDGPVTDADKERWPDQYRRFKEKREQSTEGTPLEQWPMMTPSRVSALKDVHVYTVDQLAELGDVYAANIGPDFQELKRQAKQFLAGAQSSNVAGELEQAHERIRQLEAENAELRANQKRKPGRPRKAKEEETEESPQDSDEALL